MTDSLVNPAPIPRARVVLLSGPSGSGKSSLAARTGLPTLQLDDFYKDGDDPALPRLAARGGAVDWDSPQSWQADDAVAAIRQLAETGRAEVPVYSIPASARTGTRTMELGQATAFIAEGIFAAEIAARCAAEGMLSDAICLHNRLLTTAWRRFRRDVREGRKSVPFLVRRGWRLMRAERGIVAHQVDLGACLCGSGEALDRVRSVADLQEPAPVA